ncbi:MAG: XRE family transcriptional regulator [Pseudomonadota bacterium]|jgi:transcriptional regulator with XRE-family HTH domain|uniref:helix-turn-helix domain-containing protein n=1 Tax=Sphingobium yanoikuyae TaxID=13690 RepID=UPI0013786779|nr:XRE family transcriptional regulator [Sphingobium yanoikuyae]NBB39553.1 helix-turn-helix domain-containing protein [Sphingobium yanoikuyae]
MSNILHSQVEVPRPDVLSHVAGNIRRLRAAKGLSQDALASASGVSRRMLVGIESGEANVSLSTLDRLAQALDVSFSHVVRAPDMPDNSRIDTLAWQGEDAHSRATLLGTVPAAREAELWTWSLAPGDRYPAEADAANWHEMLYVVEGVLTVEMDAGTRTITAGDFLIFSSDRPYVFVNRGTDLLRFVRNVVF